PSDCFPHPRVDADDASGGGCCVGAADPFDGDVGAGGGAGRPGGAGPVGADDGPCGEAGDAGGGFGIESVVEHLLGGETFQCGGLHGGVGLGALGGGGCPDVAGLGGDRRRGREGTHVRGGHTGQVGWKHGWVVGQGRHLVVGGEVSPTAAAVGCDPCEAVVPTQHLPVGCAGGDGDGLEGHGRWDIVDGGAEVERGGFGVILGDGDVEVAVVALGGDPVFAGDEPQSRCCVRLGGDGGDGAVGVAGDVHVAGDL